MDDNSTSIGKRIRLRRKECGMTLQQMEQLTGINNGNLSRIERGDQRLTEPTLVKISTALGVNLADLLGSNSGNISSLKVDGATIQPQVFRTYRSLQDVPIGVNVLMGRLVVSAVPADGKPKWYLDDEQPLVFNSESIRPIPSAPATLASMRHGGSAMEPRLFDGDSVIVDTSENVIPDSGGVYALIYDDELMVRRLFRRPGGGLIIKCDNPDYPTIDVGKQEADERITLVGRVKYRGGIGDF